MSKLVVYQCHRPEQSDGTGAEHYSAVAMGRGLPRRCRAAPRETLLDLPDLGESFLGDRQRFYQHGDVTQFFRHRVHILFVIDNELGHKTVGFLNAPLFKISREAKILSV